jgi:magnesium-transporting ATPase (P-type)
VSLTAWFPAIVAIATVVANAAITFSAVSRHERVIEDLRDAVQELRTEVAVLKATKGGDAH